MLVLLVEGFPVAKSLNLLYARTVEQPSELK